MKLRLIVLSLLIGLLSLAGLVGLAGCGQDDDQPIYDTANNPNNFPDAAIGLLIGLETGPSATAEDITTSFGDLYTRHSELLDNADWKMVIDRLGRRFGRTADSLKALGMLSYGEAGRFYQLASFARPDDPTFRHQAALFATWLTGIQDNQFDLTALSGEETPELTDLIDAARYFFEASPDHVEFYQTFLTEPIKNLAITHNLVTGDAVRSLGQTDRELLAAAGLTAL